MIWEFSAAGTRLAGARNVKKVDILQGAAPPGVDSAAATGKMSNRGRDPWKDVSGRLSPVWPWP